MRVLVVDDEPLARRRLVRMLQAIEAITAIGEAEDGDAALRLGPAHDVVLLDIAMPGVDGLAVARRLSGTTPVIFVTAHPQHALAAFDTEAVDYLVKPVRPERLARALSRLGPRPASARIPARGHDGVHLFDPNAIDCFWAADKVTLFEVEGREHVVDESLASLAERLPGFVRTHRSWIVRLAAVARLGRGPSGAYVVLQGGQRIPVSRRQLPELADRLGL